MLLGAFICLIIALTAGLINVLTKQATIALLTKTILHLFLLLFILLLLLSLFSSIPPRPKESSLPI